MLMMVTSVILVFVFWPSAERTLVAPSVKTLIVKLEGDTQARVVKVDFSKEGANDTLITVVSKGATTLSVVVWGPDTVVSDGEPPKAAPPCVALRGTCDNNGIGFTPGEVELLWGPSYEAHGVEDDDATDVFVSSFVIPGWEQWGYVASASRGYVEVELPSVVVVNNGRAVDDDLVRLAVSVPVDSSVRWTAGLQPTRTSGSTVDWHPTLIHGTSAPVSASGVLPAELNTNDRNLLITGVLLGVAAAAALALVAEIRPPGLSEASSKEPPETS